MYITYNRTAWNQQLVFWSAWYCSVPMISLSCSFKSVEGHSAMIFNAAFNSSFLCIRHSTWLSFVFSAAVSQTLPLEILYSEWLFCSVALRAYFSLSFNRSLMRLVACLPTIAIVRVFRRAPVGRNRMKIDFGYYAITESVKTLFIFAAFFVSFTCGFLFPEWVLGMKNVTYYQ